MKNKPLLRISIFYIIGITLSNVFRFDLLKWHESKVASSVLEIVLTSPLEAIGLIIGAFISIHLLKKKRKLNYSLFGTSRKWSLIMLAIPIILLALFGVSNRNGVNTHYYGFVGGLATILYCFCEEIGWRGYLQDELKFIKEWKRVLLIGFLWYLWHLPFVSNIDFIDNIQFLAWMIVGSWGIGKVIDSTKSVLSATCFHMIINIMMFNGLIKDGIEGTPKLVIVGSSIIIWIVILTIWKKETKAMSNEQQRK